MCNSLLASIQGCLSSTRLPQTQYVVLIQNSHTTWPHGTKTNLKFLVLQLKHLIINLSSLFSFFNFSKSILNKKIHFSQTITYMINQRLHELFDVVLIWIFSLSVIFFKKEDLTFPLPWTNAQDLKSHQWFTKGLVILPFPCSVPLNIV